MPEAFFYFLDITLFSRLVFAFRDRPITQRRLFVMLGLQVAGMLLLQMRLAFFLLVLVTIGMGVLLYYLEKKNRRLNEIRLLFLIAYLLLGSLFFSAWIGLDFSPRLAGGMQSAASYSLLLAALLKVDWLRLLTVLFGLLLVTNEANILIRFLLEGFKMAPRAEAKPEEKAPQPVDQRQFNAGRVIGILERILIYYFVLNSQYAAIGFILAAKSFTRFRELDKRRFAEYVLVGTLLSALLAILCASLVQVLLPAAIE